MFNESWAVEKATAFWEQGNQDLLGRKWGAAQRQYKRAIFLCPGDARFWVGLGRAYEGKQEYHNAKGAFESGLECFPYSSAAEEGRRECLRQLHLPDETLSLEEAGRRMFCAGNKLWQIGPFSYEDESAVPEEKTWPRADFAQKVFAWSCRRFGPLEKEQICKETILKTFLAAFCVTVLYHQAPNNFDKEDPLAGLQAAGGLEGVESQAYKLAGTDADWLREMTEYIRNYAELCWQILQKVRAEDYREAVCRGAENVCAMGALSAQR